MEHPLQNGTQLADEQDSDRTGRNQHSPAKEDGVFDDAGKKHTRTPGPGVKKAGISSMPECVLNLEKIIIFVNKEITEKRMPFV